MATTIYLEEAFERLAAQIGPLAAKDALEEWGFDGALPYYGAKSLSSDSEKIEPCKFHNLRISIECVEDNVLLYAVNGKQYIKEGNVSCRNVLLTEKGGVSRKAWLDVKVDERQFEHLRRERLVPAPTPAARDQAGSPPTQPDEPATEAAAPSAESPVDLPEANLGGRPSADTQSQPSAPTTDVQVPAQSEPEVQSGAPPPDAEPDEAVADEPGRSAESPATLPKANHGGRPTDRDLLLIEADWRLRHEPPPATLRAFARDVLRPWLDRHAEHRGLKTCEVLKVDTIEGHVRPLWNSDRGKPAKNR